MALLFFLISSSAMIILHYLGVIVRDILRCMVDALSLHRPDLGLALADVEPIVTIRIRNVLSLA